MIATGVAAMKDRNMTARLEFAKRSTCLGISKVKIRRKQIYAIPNVMIRPKVRYFVYVIIGNYNIFFPG